MYMYSMDYAETRMFKAIHQDHGRVAWCRTIAISHRTIPRRTLHTYVRRVMAKKNGDTVRLRSLPNIHHSAADSKVTKAISYSCRVSFTDGPSLKPMPIVFFYVGYEVNVPMTEPIRRYVSSVLLITLCYKISVSQHLMMILRYF